MAELAHIETNGNRGEKRTESILIEGLWTLKRSVDVDGADFLVQVPAASEKELRDRSLKIEVIGQVQAKFFEGSNTVKIARQYVEDGSGVWEQFFALLHTNDEVGKWHTYFFTASEIRKEFYVDNDGAGEYYCFALRAGRSYDAYKDIAPNQIVDNIKNKIRDVQQDKNEAFIRKVYVEVSARVAAEHARKADRSSGGGYPGSRSRVIGDHKFEAIGAKVYVSKIDRFSGAARAVCDELGELDDVESYDERLFRIKWRSRG